MWLTRNPLIQKTISRNELPVFRDNAGAKLPFRGFLDEHVPTALILVHERTAVLVRLIGPSLYFKTSAVPNQEIRGPDEAWVLFGLGKRSVDDDLLVALGPVISNEWFKTLPGSCGVVSCKWPTKSQLIQDQLGFRFVRIVA